MYSSLLTRYAHHQFRRAINSTMKFRFLAQSTTPLGAAEVKQKPLDFSTEDLINGSMGTRSASVPMIEPNENTIPSQVYEVQEQARPGISNVEKSCLAFEDIPGPAILKIWEKYWKYVPIFGKLNWNRNFVPMKYLFDKYGSIVRINGPMVGDIVMIHRPEHVAQVLRQEGESPVRSGIDVLEHYRLNYRKHRLPGPFSMQGDEWLEIKSKIEKPFSEQTSKYFSRVEATCEEFAQLVQRIRNRQDEVPANFDTHLSRWGMECFSILMFNKRLGFLDLNSLNSPSSETTSIIDALTQAHVYLSKCETGFQVWRFFETPYSRKLFEACDTIDNLVNKYIRQAQNQLSAKKSMDIQDNRMDESLPILEKLLMNQKMHPEDISALLMDMIVLGVQATVNSQAFLLYYLAKNPRVQKKLNEEIDSVLSSSGRSSLTQEDLKRMSYLKACLCECLRLKPPFPCISRILPKTITLHGYTVPKGTCLIMANEISAQREENFEDPSKFWPERWLKEESSDNSWQKFSCLPFGHGLRSCLGKNMAEKKIMLLTSKLVRQFKIEYDYADIGSKYLMVNVPNRPLRFRFVDRK